MSAYLQRPQLLQILQQFSVRAPESQLLQNLQQFAGAERFHQPCAAHFDDLSLAQ